MRSRILGCLSCVCGLVVLTACGSSSAPSNPAQPQPQPQPPPSTPALTATQINSIESLFITVEKATAPILFAEVVNCTQPTCTVTSDTTATINVAAPCPDSGTVNITAALTIAMTGASATTTTTGPIAFSTCSGGGVQLQGSLTAAGQAQIVHFAPVNPSPFTITGSASFVLNGVTGSISFSCNNSVTLTSLTPLKTVVSASGNATLQYPVGQNTTTAPCDAFNGFSQ